MPKIELREYLCENGTSPYQEWFNDLDVHAAAKVTAAKVRLETGNTSAVKWFRGIGEYVIDRAIEFHAEYNARKKALRARTKR